MGSAIQTEDKGKDNTSYQSQGSVSWIQFPTSRADNRVNKPDVTRMGELLSDRALQSLFWIYKGLGGEEDKTPSNASQETPWI